MRVLSKVVLSLLLVLAACEVPNQNASDIFLDGKMPEILEKFSNQVSDLLNDLSEPKADALRERLEADARREDLVRVMVMDNGLDITHPDLVPQIAYRLEGGRITGAGYDFMGGDGAGSSNLIEPKYFAFGAKAVVKGRIDGAPTDPLALMNELNASFMNQLIPAIQAHPVLSKSVFKRLRADTMNVFGALALKEEAKSLREMHKSNQEYGMLMVSETVRQKDPAEMTHSQRERLKSAEFQEKLHWTLDRPWELSVSVGMPRFGIQSWGAFDFAGIEHMDQFLTVVEQALASFPESARLKAAIETYVDFLLAREGVEATRESVRQGIFGDLATALSFHQYGYSIHDPIRSVGDSLAAAAMRPTGDYAGPIAPITPQRMNAALHLGLNFLELANEFDLANALSVESRRYAATEKKMLRTHRALSRWWMNDRGMNVSGRLSPGDSAPQSELYRDFLYRTQHPFVYSGSATSSHGTHVSGIIAKQSPNVRIVPVRVTTESSNNGPEQLDRMKTSFKEGFRTWLGLPLVFRAMSIEAPELFPEIDFTDVSDANRQKFVTAVFNSINEVIELSFEGNRLDYQFVSEVNEAIEYAGRERIKLANVSLGTNFESRVANLDEQDSEKMREQLFSFLRFEFFKYQVGETVQKHAANTLFFIAAGNSGQWVDGLSRSALPADLSSGFLRAAETATEKAPNNSLRNIIAVGSLNPKKRLSSFTNLVLSDVPVIFAEGESILSSIKTQDSSSANQIINRALPGYGWVSGSAVGLGSYGDEERTDKFLKSLGLLPEDLKGKQLERYRTEVATLLSQLTNAAGGMTSPIRDHLFLKYRTQRARMSGTSMATPVAVGITAGKVVQPLMASLGVSESAMYDHPEFAPSKLIDRIFQASELVSESRILSIRALMDRFEFERSEGGQAMEKFLVETRTRAETDEAVSREVMIASLREAFKPALAAARSESPEENEEEGEFPELEMPVMPQQLMAPRLLGGRSAEPMLRAR